MNRILQLLVICCTVGMISGCDSSDKENSADDSNRNSLTAKKRDADYYYDQAVKMIEANKFRDAITYCSKVIKLDSSSEAAYYNRGKAHAALDETELAITDFTVAVALDPNYAIAYYNRGLAYVALEVFFSANPRPPWPVNVMDNGNYFRGENLHLLDLSAEAIADFDKASKLDPHYGNAYYNRGNTYYMLDEKEKAIADFDKAIELDPNLAIAYYYRGLAYDDLDKPKKAKSNFAKAKELGYEPE